jgi:hypothetical protein
MEKQKTLAESSDGFYEGKKLERTFWTGGGHYSSKE